MNHSEPISEIGEEERAAPLRQRPGVWSEQLLAKGHFHQTGAMQIGSEQQRLPLL